MHTDPADPVRRSSRGMLARETGLIALISVTLLGDVAGFAPASLPLSRLRVAQVCSSGVVTRLRMQDKEKSLGKSLGDGIMGMQKVMDAVEQGNEEQDQSGKAALFGSREEAIRKASEADLAALEGEDMAMNGEVPIPEPIQFKTEDFEKSVWKVQVEKSGNWFSGNYAPDEFMVALGDADSEKVEFGGDPLTRGKWYMDGACLYIERRPFGMLGPLGPGKEYYRVSLTGWATDDNKLQGGGIVSGYSTLFPVAILGRCLVTRERAIPEEEVKKRIRAAAGKVEGARQLSGTKTKKRVKIVDLSDDLTEEEMRRKEAAEWMPSSFVDNNQPSIADQVSSSMGSSLERLKGTVEESIDNYKNIKD